MPEQRDPCNVCQLPDQITKGGASPTSTRFECARCGRYDWEDSAPLSGRAARQVLTSGYIRDQNLAGIIPLFTRDLVARVERIPMPRLRERAIRALLVMVKHKGLNTRPFNPWSDPEIQAASYSANREDLEPLIAILNGEGFLSGELDPAIRLTPKGLLEAEGYLTSATATPQVFVAMSFSEAMTPAYVGGFEPGIRAAGYRPLRIDGKEHVNSISDEIMAEIRRSRFVVADYTEMNNGVYFEAGFAFGLGKLVIPTCQADHLAKLHFDIRHINTLTWKTPDDLASGLAKRISAVVGDGPLL